MYSAWRLVQHVQNSHGIKIYVESSSSSSSGCSLTSSPGAKTAHNSSSGSTSSSSASSSSGPGPSLVPTSLGLSSPLVDPTLPIHNPFTVSGLVRMPLDPPRQFPPTSLATSLFARPSSHPDPFRMDQLVSERFRLGGLGLPPPQTFPERPIVPPQRAPVPPPPPALPLSLEPQLDFYSQRLRQLAGTTSPGPATTSPSPKKLSPPFTSPSSSFVPQTTPIVPNNNNNISTSNNNLPSPPLRAESSSPREKPGDTQNDSVDLSTTAPLSSSTPPAKPTDLSLNLSTTNAADGSEGKIHPCEYCGKKFRFQSNLAAHRRSHTGEKPYKCSVCNHACSQSSKLKRHMKVHRQKKSSQGEDGSSTNPNSDLLSNEGSGDSGDEVDDDDDDDIDEDEDEMDEEEEDEEMDLEEEDDDDEDGEAPEDLTTKSTSSTPPNNTDPKGDGDGGSPKPSSGTDKVSSGSLVGELMDKFGLSNIQQYNEAYKQALQESVGSHHISRKDDMIQRSLMSDNNNCRIKPTVPLGRLENGLIEKSAAMRFREEFAKLSGQPPIDLVGGPHGLFGTGNPFDNPFDAGKRLKMDSKESGLGRLPDRDGLYAGLWLPAMAVAHHRESLFGNGTDSIPELLKTDKHKDSNPSTSASLAAAAAAAALNLGIPAQMKKESRRNDTCEFCGKVFKNCSNLTVHRRSHTGEKPYKCELCSYACAQSSKLTRHMKTHGRMGKDVYRCRFCEMPFSVPSTLEKHMRKCVVNQNIKVEHHLMPAVMSPDEDSTSAPKDST